MPSRIIPINRRLFFRRTVRECLSFLEAVGGRPQFHIDDLWTMEKELLLAIIPGIRKGMAITVKGTEVFAQRGREGRFVHCFSIDPLNTAIFNLINGENTIAVIAEKIRLDCSGNDDCYELVRGFFLELVQRGICAPTNPVGKNVWETA
jgi:hypothetical protein